MSSLAIGLGAACCAAGAAAHFLDRTQRKEGLFGLAGFSPVPESPAGFHGQPVMAVVV